MYKDLTGKLAVGDKVLEIFHQYTEESLKQGRVIKLTKTRATIQYKRDGELYTREFTLKTGQLYPRGGDYSYTAIEPMTPENAQRFSLYIERKQLEYSIVTSRNSIDGRHHDLKKLSLTKLRALSQAFEDVARLVGEITK